MKSFLRKLCGPFYQSLTRLWNWLTAPSASVTEVGARRQAQFLAALALLMLVFVILQIGAAEITGRKSLATMLTGLLLGATLTYGFSQSPFPQWGAVLFIYGFTVFAFVLSSRVTADIATTLYGMIPLVYVLSGALLAVGWQVALVVLVFAGCIGLTIWQPGFAASAGLVTGNLTALGVVLIVTSMLRAGMERRRLAQVHQINRELETTRDALDRELNLLLDSEARVRALLAAIPDLIFELSYDGAFLDFIPSQALESFLQPEHFLGRGVTEVLPPEIAAVALRAVQQVLAGAGVQTFEYQLPLGDVLHDYEARVVASRHDAALAIVRDITERKKAEKDIRASQERLSVLIERSPLAVIEWDLDFRVVAWNPAAEKLYGYRAEEVIGRYVGEIMVPETGRSQIPDYVERIERQKQDILAQKGDQHRVVINFTKDGRRIICEWFYMLLINADGQTFGVATIGLDITERTQLKAEREALVVELETKNAELERFAYTVSHDLKSPLITIGNFVGFLEKDALSGDVGRIRTDTVYISDAVTKMQRMLDELLELSRIGRQIHLPEEVPFEEIAREAIERVRGRIEVQGIEVEIAPNLPFVYGDRTQLVEVVQNLVDNACKFMGDQPYPRIEIGTRQVDNETVFYVRDNGIGIDPQYGNMIFGLFNKLNPQSEGTGVGLTLVKRVIETHGGRIWVESQLGQGAMFCMILPILANYRPSTDRGHSNN